MKKALIILKISLYSYVFLGLTSCGLIVSNVDEPPYKVLSKKDAIEIRQYNTMVIAQVQTQGERNEAAKAGFRLLADYIFGENIKQANLDMTAPVSQESSQKVPMTAPVIQQENENIPMTAPVIQQESDDIPMTAPVTQQAEGNQWYVRFVMPEGETLQSLPKPKNDAVKLIEVPSKKYIVIQFSGRSTRANLDENKALLNTYIVEHNIQTISSPIYAFYNPPWTIPLFRRNEIMMEIR